MERRTTVRRLAALFGVAAVVILAGCHTDEIHIDYDGDVAVDRCLSFADIGSGPVRETWRCFDTLDRHRTMPLVTLTRLGGGSYGFGEVFVGDTTHPADFRVDGLNWRWNFGCTEDGAYPYSFIIEPDGTGLYYNFRPSADGRADPSEFYDCEM